MSQTQQNEPTRYFFIVSGNDAQPMDHPLFFVYTTPTNDEHGSYTVRSADPERQAYWAEWLQRRYYTPSGFMTRFGYMNVDAGLIRDDYHMRELEDRCGLAADGGHV